MKIPKNISSVTQIKRRYIEINQKLLQCGITLESLEPKDEPSQYIYLCTVCGALLAILSILTVLCEYNILQNALIYAQSVRCVIPNNYFIWEATRPIPDCQFCINVTQPIVLPNVTKEQFKKYVYTSKPVVVKEAFTHWPAMKHFDFEFFRNLYNRVENSYRSVDEECQFLHFKSNFISLRDVFAMDEARIKNVPGQKSWYVGW